MATQTTTIPLYRLAGESNQFLRDRALKMLRTTAKEQLHQQIALRGGRAKFTQRVDGSVSKSIDVAMRRINFRFDVTSELDARAVLAAINQIVYELVERHSGKLGAAWAFNVFRVATKRVEAAPAGKVSLATGDVARFRAMAVYASYVSNALARRRVLEAASGKRRTKSVTVTGQTVRTTQSYFKQGGLGAQIALRLRRAPALASFTVKAKYVRALRQIAIDVKSRGRVLIGKIK
jgi:hypothetical protein